MFNGSGVEFDGESRISGSIQNFNNDPSKFVQWTIKYSGGLIKDEKSASYFLLGLTVLFIVISLFLFFSNDSPKIPTGALKNPTYGLPIKD